MSEEINLYEADAPDGQCWKCPDCTSWASLGCNAAHHMRVNRHGFPTLRPIPITPEPQSHDWNVICPYCHYSYQAESCDFSDQEREEECAKCGQTYLLCDDMSVTHRTRPKP